VLGMYLPVMLFVLSGYEHNVANMYYISAGIFAATNPVYAGAASAAGVSNLSALSWGNMFLKNMLPVTIGNIIGGSIFLGLSYWFVYLRHDKTETKKK